MTASRAFLLVLTIIGLIAGLWIARPDEPTAIVGWVFACFSAFAWFLAIILCLVSFKLNRVGLAIGGLFVLGVSELLLHIHLQDALFLVMKPVYQSLLLAVGAFFGAPFRGSASAPNTSLERTREG